MARHLRDGDGHGQFQLLGGARQRLTPVRDLPGRAGCPGRPRRPAAPAATARSPRTAPATAPTPAPGPHARAAYAADRSRASGPFDQPSPAMWCTTTSSTCSSGPTANSQAADGDLGGQVEERTASAAATAAASFPGATGTVSCHRSSLGGQGSADTAHRRLAGRRCAAPRAGQSHPAAPHPALRGPASPVRRSAAGMLYVAAGPSNCPMNQSRCCANDNGTRSGCSRAIRGRHGPTRAPPAGPPARPPSACRTAPGWARHAQQRPHPAHQRVSQQRVAAEFEEVVVHADALQPEDLARTPRTGSPRARGRSPPGARLGPAKSGPGSALRSSLPLPSAAEPPGPRRPRAPCAPATGRATNSRTASERSPVALLLRPPHRRPGATAPGAHGHRRLRHQRMRDQHRLHLTRLHPEPPHLHLVIGPAREDQLTIRRPPRPVPRPIHPLSRRRRTGRPQTAPPSDPHAPHIPAPTARPPHTTHPPHPPAPAAALRPARRGGCCHRRTHRHHTLRHHPASSRLVATPIVVSVGP